ncbi:MAG TPA: YetF domain-containing protein [Streptosporangiales bacterium]
MWHNVLVMGIPVGEKVLRTVAVYAALAILLRVSGKRDLGDFNTFDLVVMLLLSNVVQNAIIGPDNSLTGGLLGALILVVINAVMVRLAAGSGRLHRVLEGTPTVLATHGRFDEHALHREGLRRGDVEAALRRQGAQGVESVESAVLAPGGSVVVELVPELQPATKGDVASLVAHIERLEARLAELDRGR